MFQVYEWHRQQIIEQPTSIYTMTIKYLQATFACINCTIEKIHLLNANNFHVRYNDFYCELHIIHSLQPEPPQNVTTFSQAYRWIGPFATHRTHRTYLNARMCGMCWARWLLWKQRANVKDSLLSSSHRNFANRTVWSHSLTHTYTHTHTLCVEIHLHTMHTSFR